MLTVKYVFETLRREVAYSLFLLGPSTVATTRGVAWKGSTQGNSIFTCFMGNSTLMRSPCSFSTQSLPTDLVSPMPRRDRHLCRCPVPESDDSISRKLVSSSAGATSVDAVR